MKVTKRNGKTEGFDIRKIGQAVRKAYAEVNVNYDENVVRAVRLWIGKRDEIGVEEIQDAVEEVLMKYSEKTAKAYILYRERHRQLRETQGLFDIGQIDKYVQKDDWMVNENANMSYSLQGMNIYITSKVTSNYWLEKLYPSKVSKAHRSGDLHIHDLNMLGVYCVGWDLMDLLTVGFKGTRDKIESRPAKHFATALMHVVNFLYTLTGEAAGAVAFSNFDTLMAPFVREDMLTDNEVRQELQRFIFNMNVPTRVGFQQPFSNLSVDLECPKFLKDQGAIVGGKMCGEVYGEFGVEQRLINRILAELMCEGDAKGMPFTFPIINYSLVEGMDFEAYPEVWEMTAKYGLPYFTNYIGTDMNPDDVRSMCCRLALDKKELMKRGGGLFGSNPLTGSCGVVTLNMPRIGRIAKDDDEYMERIGELMDLSMESLEVKRKVIERLTEMGMYPYSKYYLRSVKEATGKYWTNHFSTIGLVGMNESMMRFMGKDMSDGDAIRFAGKVLEFMRGKLVGYQEETGSMYNLEATPAEGCSYSLALADKRRFGEAEVVYTNSTALPVDFEGSFIEAIGLQERLQQAYSGGTVMHLYLGEGSPEPSAIMELVKRVASKTKLPYFTIVPQYSICRKCGRLGGFHEVCPKCGGNEVEAYSRVVGYLRPVDAWNVGKKYEFKKRKYFKIGE